MPILTKGDFAILRQRTFTSRHIERVTGGAVNDALLRQWVMQGRLLKVEKNAPAPLQITNGSGLDRQFHLVQVHHFALISELVRAGIDVEKATGWATVVFSRVLKAPTDDDRPRLLVFSADEQELFCPSHSSTREFLTALHRAIGAGASVATTIIDLDSLFLRNYRCLLQMSREDTELYEAATPRELSRAVAG